MNIERKALVLCHIHSKLLIANLEVALHEAKISKNPAFKILGLELSKLKYVTNNAFRNINKEINDMGGTEALEDEINEIMDQTWSEDTNT